MSGSVLKRLKVLENQFETTAEDDERVRELTDLLRQYEAVTEEMRKLPNHKELERDCIQYVVNEYASGRLSASTEPLLDDEVQSASENTSGGD